MKKLLLGITIVAALFLTASGALAGSSAPKTLCYKWDPFVTTFLMSMKNQGTIKTADGTVKYYSIHGSVVYPTLSYPASPLTGTATFSNDVLRFNHVTIARHSGSPGTDPGANYYQILTEGTFNTATGTGAVTYSLMNVPAALSTVTMNNRNNVTVSAVACENYSISSSFAETELSASDMIKIGLIPE